MNGKISPSEDQPKKSRKLSAVVIVLVIVASSLLIGWSIFWYQNNVQCGIACGPAIDVPVLLKATLNQSTDTGAPQNCGIINNGYPQSVVCQVVTSPGTSGSIILKLDSQNGNSTVAFGAYSSNQYVQFTSKYSCMYSSNLPDYNTLHCQVLSSGSTYKFNYNVSESLPSPQEVVLTIVVTKTCCFP